MSGSFYGQVIQSCTNLYRAVAINIFRSSLSRIFHGSVHHEVLVECLDLNRRSLLQYMIWNIWHSIKKVSWCHTFHFWIIKLHHANNLRWIRSTPFGRPLRHSYSSLSGSTVVELFPWRASRAVPSPCITIEKGSSVLDLPICLDQERSDQCLCAGTKLQGCQRPGWNVLFVAILLTVIYFPFLLYPIFQNACRYIAQ